MCLSKESDLRIGFLLVIGFVPASESLGLCRKLVQAPLKHGQFVIARRACQKLGALVQFFEYVACHVDPITEARADTKRQAGKTRARSRELGKRNKRYGRHSKSDLGEFGAGN